MLVTAQVETRRVIYRSLRLAAFVCCGLVVVSFAMFARDQAAGASEHQQSELVAGTPTTTASPALTHRHSQPRRFIDGAAKTLTSPFSSIVHSNDVWVQRGLPTIFGLLVYGIGLGFLARYSRGSSGRLRQ
jgi:hypothetical protein